MLDVRRDKRPTLTFVERSYWPEGSSLRRWVASIRDVDDTEEFESRRSQNGFLRGIGGGVVDSLPGLARTSMVIR